MKPPKGIEFEVPTPTAVVVKGIDKQQVGQVAAEIRKLRPPEPYKGKGIRYQGEYVRARWASARRRASRAPDHRDETGPEHIMARITKRDARLRRHRRVRKVAGTAARPRLAVFRSNAAIDAQIIDDEHGHTIAAADSRGVGDGDKSARAKEAGKLLAERAKAAGVEAVVFDRGGYLYHGRVKALADGAREGGLHF